jgi:ArsR family transcriptional regulator
MAQARSREAPAAADVLRGGGLTRPLSAEEAADLVQAFKALADPVRLRLLSMISSAPDGEICVCYLNEAFDLAAPTISYHLKILRDAGLIDGDRRGTWVYYRVVPEVLGGVGTMLATSALSAGARQARAPRAAVSCEPRRARPPRHVPPAASPAAAAPPAEGAAGAGNSPAAPLAAGTGSAM